MLFSLNFHYVTFARRNLQTLISYNSYTEKITIFPLCHIFMKENYKSFQNNSKLLYVLGILDSDTKSKLRRTI